MGNISTESHCFILVKAGLVWLGNLSRISCFNSLSVYLLNLYNQLILGIETCFSVSDDPATNKGIKS